MQFEFIVNFEKQFAKTCFPLTLIFKFAKKNNRSIACACLLFDKSAYRKYRITGVTCQHVCQKQCVHTNQMN